MLAVQLPLKVNNNSHRGWFLTLPAAAVHGDLPPVFEQVQR